MEFIQQHAVELLIGAFGYNVKKYFGEQISKYIFKPVFNRLKSWLIMPLLRAGKKHLIRTHRDTAIWLHYWNKAHQQGHQHKNPMICEDDRCRLI
jgi:hypothetical protein